MRPLSIATARPSSAMTSGSTRRVHRGQIKASIVCIGGFEALEKKASKYSFPDHVRRYGRQVPVLNFCLVFWALGCVVGAMREPCNRSSALPGKTLHLVDFPSLRAVAGGWRAGPYFIERSRWP